MNTETPADISLILREHLQKESDILWQDPTPALDHIVRKGKVKEEIIDGKYVKFAPISGRPGNMGQVVFGDEAPISGRNNIMVEGRAYISMHQYGYGAALPTLALAAAAARNGNVNALDDFWEANGRAGVADLIDRCGKQLINGQQANSATGFPTLYGGTTGSPVTYNANPSVASAATNGMIMFGTPAAQEAAVATTYNIPRSVADGWYNYYQAITNYPAHGRRKIQRVVEYTGHPTMRGKDKATLFFTDTTSDAIVYDDYRSEVRTERPKDTTEVRATGKAGRPFMGGLLWSDVGLDDAALSSHNGLMLITAPDTIFRAQFPALSGLPGVSDTETPPDTLVSDTWIKQDHFQINITHVLTMALWTRMLRAHGGVDGIHLGVS